MFDPETQQLIEQVHASPWQLVMAVTGGGSRAISDLLAVPGASRTLLEATVPYANPALREYLGGAPDGFCSAHTARAMAMLAFERARSLTGGDPKHLAGVGCTASLASDRPKRGAHRVHVAVQTAAETRAKSIVLNKGERSRAEEEALCGQVVLNEIARAASIGVQIELSTLPGDELTITVAGNHTSWTNLLLGRSNRVGTGSDGDPPTEIIFPGAFNPLHAGHVDMARIAEQMLGQALAYEICIENVDKPPLDFIDIETRLTSLAGTPVWLTRAPTFLEKSELFPGATFIVGADTIVRIADPKYYGDDPAAAAAAIGQIAARGCRFLVFGRLIEGHFRTLSVLELPHALSTICHKVPADIFREDISSTDLRTAGDEEDPESSDPSS